MKCNNKMKLKFFAAALTVLIALCAQPARSFALELRVRNDFNIIMRIALVYFETNSQKWRITGWYHTEPYREKHLTFDASKKEVYIYAKLEDESLTWGNGDIARTVISDAFSYYDGQECPWGNRRRVEKFTKYEAINNIIEFRPRAGTSQVPVRSAEYKQAPNSDGAYYNSDKEEFRANTVRLLDLINAERRKVGASTLRLDETMCKAAERRADEITILYSHDRPDGSSFSTVFAEFRFSPRKSAENIAWRSGAGNTDMSKFNKAFMNSEGHRINMLNSDYSIIGLGFSKFDEKYYVVELFAEALTQNKVNAGRKKQQ